MRVKWKCLYTVAWWWRRHQKWASFKAVKDKAQWDLGGRKTVFGPSLTAPGLNYCYDDDGSF